MIMSRRQYGASLESAGPGRWKGRHQLVNSNFSNVKCRKLQPQHQLRHRADHHAEFPAIAVGRPTAWVRAGMASLCSAVRPRTIFQETARQPTLAGAEGVSTKRLYRAVGCKSARRAGGHSKPRRLPSARQVVVTTRPCLPWGPIGGSEYRTPDDHSLFAYR